MTTQTKPPRNEAAYKLWNDLGNTMANLMCRWLDEHGYEDIADYAAVIRPHVEKIGGNFVRMTKRPFGFIYELDGRTYTVAMKASGDYSYKSSPLTFRCACGNPGRIGSHTAHGCRRPGATSQATR